MNISVCVVPGCGSRRRGHTFPQDPVRQENWLKAVKWEREEKPHKAAFVCCSHFKETDYRHQKEERKVLPGVRRRLRLKKNAVPYVFSSANQTTRSNPEDAVTLIEVGVKIGSPNLEESYTVGDLSITVEDGITESEVNDIILNARGRSSPVKDDEISTFVEIVRSKLFDDNEETPSIFLPAVEGTLEITNKLPSVHPLDYDSDNEDGFITISRDFVGFNDGSDLEDTLSDITIPLKNRTLADEHDEGGAIGSEQYPTPTVANIIVFDANEEGVRTMKSLLLAQMKADQTVPTSPPSPIDTCPRVEIERESQNEQFEPQNQTEFITEAINDLKLTPETPIAPDIPTASDTPTAHDTPTATGTPTAPDTPTAHDTPTATGTPTAPDSPTTPDTPPAPDTPTASATPTAPDTTTASGTPTAPEQPKSPIQVSKSRTLVSEIRKSRPKVLVNRRKVMVIKKSSGGPNGVKNNGSSVTPLPSVDHKHERSFEPPISKLPTKGSTVDLIFKTYTRRRPQFCIKRFNNKKKNGDPTYIIITKKNREGSDRSKEMEHDKSPPNSHPALMNDVASSNAVSVTRMKRVDSISGPKNHEIHDHESNNDDDDSSLDLCISVSSEAGSCGDTRLAELEEYENISSTNQNNVADSKKEGAADGLLTIDLASDEETGVDDLPGSAESTETGIEEIPKSTEMAETGAVEMPGSAETTIIVETDIREIKSPTVESSSCVDESPEMPSCIMVPPSDGVDPEDSARNDVDLVCESENASPLVLGIPKVSPRDSNMPEEAILLSKDANNEQCHFEVRLEKAKFIVDDIPNGVQENCDDGDPLNGFGMDEPDVDDSACLVVVVKNQSLNNDIENAASDDAEWNSPCRDSSDIDFGHTVTILDDAALQKIYCTAEDEEQRESGNGTEWERFSVTDSDLTDLECSDELVHEDCLQFEVVENDSEMVLEEIHHSPTQCPITGQLELPKNAEFDVIQAGLEPVSNAALSSTPYTVPTDMLFRPCRKKRPGRPPRSPLPKPPPLILPDHDYTRHIEVPKRKKRIRKQKYDLTVKTCSVLLERLSPSVLAQYYFDSESNEQLEEPVIQPLSSPPPAENLICFHCNMAGSSKEILCKHITCHHTDNMFLCPHCGEKFNSVLDCNNHIGICDYIVESRTSYTTYLCPQCDFSTKDDSALRGHIDVEHRVQCNHYCQICPFKCVSETALQNHLKRYHALSTNVVSSSVSQPSRMITITNQSSQIHQPASSVKDTDVEHEIQWNHPCPICYVKCTSDSSLQKHVKHYHDVPSSVGQSSTPAQSKPIVSTSQVHQTTSSLEHIKEDDTAQCKKCPFRSKSENILQIHVSCFHPNIIKESAMQSSTSVQSKPIISPSEIDQPESLPELIYSCTKCPFQCMYASEFQEHIEFIHPSMSVAQSVVSTYSTNQIQQTASSVQQPESSMKQHLTSSVQISSNTVRVQNSMNLVQQTSNLVLPSGRMYHQYQNLAQKSSNPVMTPIMLYPPGRVVQQPSNLLTPQSVSVQKPGKVVEQPQSLVQSLGGIVQPRVFQPGCTVRQPRILAPGYAQQLEKKRVKCIFPTPRPIDQFTPLVPASWPTPPPKPKTEIKPEVEIDLTDTVDDCIECPECDETKATYADLGRHIVECHSKNRRLLNVHKCHICSRSCATKYGLQQHIRLKHSSVMCPEGCSYISRNFIHQHMVTKHRSQCFLCDCNFISTVDSVMQLHKMVMHKMLPESDVISCPVCPPHTTNFRTLNALTQHANQRHFFLFKTNSSTKKPSAENH